MNANYLPVAQRTYLTEIKLQNAIAVGQRIPFLDVPELSQRGLGAMIYAIECFNATDLSVSPNGNAVCPLVTGMVVTFAEEATETVFQYPCNDLRPANNSGLIRMFNNKKINLPKSYITLFSVAGIAQNQSVLFNFYYATVTR